MSNMEIYEAFRAVPKEATKKITGGRLNGFTDINPVWRIKKLTEQFGPCGIGWYVDITDRWQETYGQEVAVFVKVSLFVKAGEGWSAPIVGVGGSKVASRESNGIYFNDEGWKMAFTDAISVACKSLGMAADIYFEKDVVGNQTKYDKVPGAATAGKQADTRKAFTRGGKAWNTAVARAKDGDDEITRSNLEKFYIISDALWKEFCADVAA